MSCPLISRSPLFRGFWDPIFSSQNPRNRGVWLYNYYLVDFTPTKTQKAGRARGLGKIGPTKLLYARELQITIAQNHLGTIHLDTIHARDLKFGMYVVPQIWLSDFENFEFWAFYGRKTVKNPRWPPFLHVALLHEYFKYNPTWFLTPRPPSPVALRGERPKSTLLRIVQMTTDYVEASNWAP